MYFLRPAALLLLLLASYSSDITAYDARIVANRSECYRVSETIIRDFKEPRHGLSRFLPTADMRYGTVIDVPHHPSRVTPANRDGSDGLEARNPAAIWNSSRINLRCW
jgi:hypothetical protein